MLMSDDLKKALLLLLVASGAAALANGLRPDRLAWFGGSGGEQAVPGGSELTAPRSEDQVLRAWRRGGAVFVDVRSQEEYQQGHIPGALNIPAERKSLHLDSIVSLLPVADRVILYGPRPEVANLYVYLLKFGFSSRHLETFYPGRDFLKKHGRFQKGRKP